MCPLDLNIYIANFKRLPSLLTNKYGIIYSTNYSVWIHTDSCYLMLVCLLY